MEAYVLSETVPSSDSTIIRQLVLRHTKTEKLKPELLDRGNVAASVQDLLESHRTRHGDRLKIVCEVVNGPIDQTGARTWTSSVSANKNTMEVWKSECKVEMRKNRCTRSEVFFLKDGSLNGHPHSEKQLVFEHKTHQ